MAADRDRRTTGNLQEQFERARPLLEQYFQEHHSLVWKDLDIRLTNFSPSMVVTEKNTGRGSTPINAPSDFTRNVARIKAASPTPMAKSAAEPAIDAFRPVMVELWSNAPYDVNGSEKARREVPANGQVAIQHGFRS